MNVLGFIHEILRFIHEKAVPVLLAGLSAWGAKIVLFEILDGVARLVGCAVLAFLISLRWKVPVAVRWLGGVVVPVLGLLTLNYLWAEFGLKRPEPVPGVFAAGVWIVIFVSAYYASWWVNPPSSPGKAWTWGAVVAVVLVVLVPVGVGLWRYRDADEPERSTELASHLDVILIVGGTRSPDIGQASEPRGWEIDYYLGRPDGRQVAWVSGAPPPPSEEADRVHVLAVDGAPSTLDGADRLEDVRGGKGEVRRWLRIARGLTGANATPTFALLQTQDEARLAEWRKRLGALDGKRLGRGLFGGVRSLQKLAGPRTVGDVALKLGTNSPTADEDMALAAQHRPFLLFDRGEKTARPLNVDTLLATGEFKLCPDQPVRVLSCSDVRSWRDLSNGSNRLSFETDQLAKATRDSTVYVNVTSHETFGSELVYLDYWWYLPDNPTNAGGGALCGAGLVIPEITCLDHQSDWEGVTVVVDRRAPPLSPPVAVQYAAHKHRTRYSWEVLQRLWRQSPTAEAIANAELNTELRPAVFIARGTHAAYPSACLRQTCSEPPASLTEKRHGGDQPWLGNKSDNACEGPCYNALPTRAAGKRRAEWNAYEGHWGTLDCQWRFFCSSADAPRGPGTQPRYTRPWCATRAWALVDGKQRRDKRAACPA